MAATLKNGDSEPLTICSLSPFSVTKNGYKRVDVLKTLKYSWTERFHSKAPNLEDISEDFDIADISLERSGTKLVLLATINQGELGFKKKDSFTFQIEESHFKS
jgi:hypothetical protein